MSNHGYIYVRNWDKRQHHKYESPPWHKVYNSLLHDDDYLSLSAADRGVLHALWMLASVSGDGRLSANSKSLARRLNVRRVSLEPLIQAGFIEVLGTKRVRGESRSVTTEKEESREEIQVQPTVVPVAAPESTRPRNEQWDALVEIFGYSPGAQVEQRLWGKLTTQLRLVHATHDSIIEAAHRYPTDMPGATLTPPALAKHYERLMAPNWHAPTTTRNGRGGAGDTIALMQSEQRRQLGTS